MADPTCLKLSTTGAVRTIALNRPEKRNALSDTLVSELIAAIAEADDDREIRVIVLSGVGDHFSAGFDLKQSSYAKIDQPLEHYTWMIRSMRATYLALFNARTPMVAKVRGYCVSGGCYLQMLCDVSVAADDAILGHPAVTTGGVSAMPLWNHYLGLRKAKELLLTGKVIDGAEAARIGLVNAAVPADELDDEVDQWAQQIAAMPPDAAVLCKEALNSCADIMGLGASFRTHGHLSALARYGEVDLDLGSTQQRNSEQISAKR